MVSRRSILRILMNRRSIRFFKEGRISPSVVRLMVEAGQRAPCSFQSYSVILIDDKEIRERLAELTDDQLFVKSPLLLLICIDFRRTTFMFDILGERHVLRSDKHPVETVEAIFEAGLFVENIVIAAEALGFGSVMLDYALWMSREVSTMLRLPRGVVPLMFLCIGVPAENPPLRPRLPLDMVLHINNYREPSIDELKRYIEEATKKLAKENYLQKYANVNKTYSEYLLDKISIDKQVEKLNSAISSFLNSNGIKV
ncbi:MAG: nitroreductase family protein [Nitrososphaerota archaeon]